MKPTHVDLKFWQQKNLPGWAQDQNNQTVTIDAVINSHVARDRRDPDYHHRSTQNLIRMSLKNMRRTNPDATIEDVLEDLLHRAGGRGRRVSIYRRYLNKLRASKGKAMRYPPGLLEIDTDYDFGIEFKGNTYADDIVLMISPDEFDDLKLLGPFCAEVTDTSNLKCAEYTNAMECIKANPDKYYSNMGGNRGVEWTPDFYNRRK